MRPSSSLQRIIGFVAALVLGILAFTWATGAAADIPVQPAVGTPAPAPAPAQPVLVPTVQAGAPVTVNGTVIFRVRERLGSFTPSERADAISKRITDLATNPFLQDVVINVVDSDQGTDVVANNDVLLTVTDGDASAYGKPRYLLAEDAAVAIQRVIDETRAEQKPHTIVFGVLQALLVLGITVLLLYSINAIYKIVRRRLQAGPGLTKRGGPLWQSDFYTSGQFHRLISMLLSLVRVILWIVILILVLPVILRFFPGTRRIADSLLGFILKPLAAFWRGFIEYLPNLGFLIVITTVAWMLIKGAKLFFKEIERETIRIGGFDPEWAPFTYRLTAFLIVALAAVIAFPYIPGAQSPAFQGISIFIGALITFSSSSAISNLVAGVVLMYTGAFRVGDLVQMGNTTGHVVAKTLLATRLRTFKNEEVSVPNSQALAGSITNLSHMTKTEGLILHTSITIGYDAPWRQVQDLLIAAALATPDIRETPPPFVLQTALGDYNVAYELNVYAGDVSRLPRLYSALHQNIQDKFNEAGVEIMSPTYSALRDGNHVTIPGSYLPADYVAPGFRVSPSKLAPADQPAPTAGA
jgi:small-conductance mechanosensitive channel